MSNTLKLIYASETMHTNICGKLLRVVEARWKNRFAYYLGSRSLKTFASRKILNQTVEDFKLTLT